MALSSMPTGSDACSRFPHTGWSVRAVHEDCGKAQKWVRSQTVRRWGRGDEPPTVTEDVRDGCDLCFAAKVELKLAAGWELSGEPCVARERR